MDRQESLDWSATMCETIGELGSQLSSHTELVSQWSSTYPSTKARPTSETEQRADGHPSFHWPARDFRRRPFPTTEGTFAIGRAEFTALETHAYSVVFRHIAAASNNVK